MKNQIKKNKEVVIFGLFIILLASLFNAWTITIIFSSYNAFISSLNFRTIIWVFDILCILLGYLFIRYNRKTFLSYLVRRVIKFMVAVFLIVLIFELLLRLTSSFWPLQTQDVIFEKYTGEPGGIYFTDPRYDLQVMKPSFKQDKMFYGGRWWLHRSNKIGIRDNRDIKKADIVLLGDSVIYGHGVNVENSLADYLDRLSGFTVANLGTQADYPPYEYIRLKHLGLFLRPKVVLFFINGCNDGNDFAIYHPTEYFINKLILEKAPDYSKGVEASDYLSYYKKTYPFGSIFLDNLLVYRFYHKTVKLLNKINEYKYSPFSSENEKLRSKIMKKILTDANRLCRINGAKLIVVFTGIDVTIHKTDPCVDFTNLCKEITNAIGVPYLDLGEESPDINFLLKDGHYSPLGNKWAADCIWEYLKNSKLLMK